MNIIGEGSQVIVGFLKLNKMKFWSKVSNSLEETPGELKCTYSKKTWQNLHTNFLLYGGFLIAKTKIALK